MKADPKMKADGKADGADAGSGKKKLLLIIGAAVLVIGAGGGGAAWYFTRAHDAGGEHAAAPKPRRQAKVEAPVFVPVDPFTVNLQQENGDQYLQIAFTLQVPYEDQAKAIKDNMPQVRSRLLLLLSSKKASELTTTDGKKALSAEIIAAVNLPFTPSIEPQNVTGVFFTSFIVQ